jgi:hypothetical protein
LRKNYLEQLAEALVVKRSPIMLESRNDDKRVKRTAKEVKRLIQLEPKSYLYRMIGRILGDKHANTSGLTRVDVPAPFIQAPNCQIDPKTWKGPWVSLTDPSEIEKHVCNINTKQYNQAQHTPFGSGYLVQQIGMTLESPAAEEILRGTFVPDPEVTLLPETERILKYLSAPPVKRRQTFPTSIITS